MDKIAKRRAQSTRLLLQQARNAPSTAVREDAHLQLVLLYADTAVASALAHSFGRSGAETGYIERMVWRSLLRAVVSCVGSCEEHFETCITVAIETEMAATLGEGPPQPTTTPCCDGHDHLASGPQLVGAPASRRRLRTLRHKLNADEPFERVAALLDTSQEVVGIIMRQERHQALLAAQTRVA